MNEVSTPQSHSVTTTFCSRPSGRGGASGIAPLAMRSLQSANIWSAGSRPNRFMALLIWLPRWPVVTRWSHAATVESNSSRSCTTRVAVLPSWWQSWQPCFMLSTQCDWVRMLGLMPLPLFPVPGNSLAAGGSISEYQ